MHNKNKVIFDKKLKYKYNISFIILGELYGEIICILLYQTAPFFDNGDIKDYLFFLLFIRITLRLYLLSINVSFVLQNELEM